MPNEVEETAKGGDVTEQSASQGGSQERIDWEGDDGNDECNAYASLIGSNDRNNRCGGRGCRHDEGS